MNPKRTVSIWRRGLAARRAACLLFACLSAARIGSAREPTSPSTGQLFELRVVDPQGKPVPEANVEIRSPLAAVAKPIKRGKLVDIHGTSRWAVKTESDGQLVVELPMDPERFTVTIEQPGFAPYWAQWDVKDTAQSVPKNIVAQLDAGWSVGGVVVDGEGNSVEGATVSPSVKFKKRPGDFSELYTGDRMKTDADGKWRFDHVPASMRDVHVTINHPDFMPTRLMLSRSEFGLDLAAEPARKVELKRGVMIAGTVTDENGGPIAGAVIRTKFLNQLRDATTDDDGTYFLGGCEPRMTRIVAIAKGRALELQQVRVQPGMPPVDFVLKPGATIRVRVVGKNGNPVPRSRIFFQRWRGHIDYFEFDHVNQYTDANGVWEWNEAPHDEIKADICPPGAMQLAERSLQAREKEYVFTRVPLLVISGKVVDVDTKQAIENFRVVPGVRWDNSQMFWSQHEAYDATGGKYQVKENRDDRAYVVRIEADGYEPAVSRDIKADEGSVTIDFELKPSKNVEIVLTTPEGTPAAGAEMAVGVNGSQIHVENGDIHDGMTYAARYTADGEGRFSIPPQEPPFQLMITHPSGFAHLVVTDPSAVPDAIKLTPWARVEGTFRTGSELGKRIAVELNSNSLPSHRDLRHIYSNETTVTNADGDFVFERVFPGKARIGRRIIYMVDEGATEVTSSKMVPLELPPGETVRVELGGDGRPVIGTLAPPASHQEEVPWSFARIHVQVGQRPKAPPAPADVQNDPERYQAWWKEWSESDEGKAWREANSAYLKRREESPYFNVSVDGEGSFRIDDMPPGEYVLRVDMHERPVGRLTDYRFSVPEPDGDESREPVDLGLLTLEPPQSRP